MKKVQKQAKIFLPIRVRSLKQWAKRAMLPLKDEKIGSFITFTLNLIPKSLTAHHVFNYSSKFEIQHSRKAVFQGSKMPFFQNFTLIALGIFV